MGFTNRGFRLMSLPLAKLGVVFVKQISKPVGNTVKAVAARQQTLHTTLARFGKLALTIEHKLNQFFLGKDATKMKLLSKEVCVDRGGDVLAEVFLFGLVGGATVWEYKSIAKKNALKEEKKTAELQAVHDRYTNDIAQLQGTVLELRQSLDVTLQRLSELERTRTAKAS
eukprot:c1926_g1_i1.p1 GENE.c1926_g1_i1~~c1926_g1_i1.p1  ORF type:complete len:170 (+),score=37.59 c1926_g1_i1:1-510(+)